MACGKAVLATDRGGPRESMIHGETGFLCRDDEETFEQAIAQLAGMPSTVLDRMGLKARARAAEFSWDAFVDRIDAHIDLATWPGRPVVKLNRVPVRSGLW
jgi:glycosyltransferase involved in cell wall biosynthesis